MRGRALLVVACAACNFPSPMLAQDAAPADGAIPDVPTGDAGPSACEQRWLDGSVAFESPAPLTELSAVGDAWHPFLTADEKTIVYAVFQGGDITNNDIYTARRTGVGAQFAAPAIEADLTSATDESKVSITDDGLIAILARTDTANSNKPSLWYGARASTQSAFVFSMAKVGALNTKMTQYDPDLSPDGRTLYFAAGDAQLQIYVSTRPDTVSDFGDPVLVDLAMPSQSLSGTAVSRDGRVLVVNVNRSMMYATRATAGGSFGALTPVPFTGAATANTAFLSADTCRLYTASEDLPRFIRVIAQTD